MERVEEQQEMTGIEPQKQQQQQEEEVESSSCSRSSTPRRKLPHRMDSSDPDSLSLLKLSEEKRSLCRNLFEEEEVVFETKILNNHHNGDNTGALEVSGDNCQDQELKNPATGTDKDDTRSCSSTTPTANSWTVLGDDEEEPENQRKGNAHEAERSDNTNGVARSEKADGRPAADVEESTPAVKNHNRHLSPELNVIPEKSDISPLTTRSMPSSATAIPQLISPEQQRILANLKQQSNPQLFADNNTKKKRYQKGLSEPLLKTTQKDPLKNNDALTNASDAGGATASRETTTSQPKVLPSPRPGLGNSNHGLTRQSGTMHINDVETPERDLDSMPVARPPPVLAVEVPHSANGQPLLKPPPKQSPPASAGSGSHHHAYPHHPPSMELHRQTGKLHITPNSQQHTTPTPPPQHVVTTGSSSVASSIGVSSNGRRRMTPMGKPRGRGLMNKLPFAASEESRKKAHAAHVAKWQRQQQQQQQAINGNQDEMPLEMQLQQLREKQEELERRKRELEALQNQPLPMKRFSRSPKSHNKSSDDDLDASRDDLADDSIIESPSFSLGAKILRNEMQRSPARKGAAPALARVPPRRRESVVDVSSIIGKSQGVEGPTTGPLISVPRRKQTPASAMKNRRKQFQRDHSRRVIYQTVTLNKSARTGMSSVTMDSAVKEKVATAHAGDSFHPDNFPFENLTLDNPVSTHSSIGYNSASNRSLLNSSAHYLAALESQTPEEDNIGFHNYNTPLQTHAEGESMSSANMGTIAVNPSSTISPPTREQVHRRRSSRLRDDASQGSSKVSGTSGSLMRRTSHTMRSRPRGLSGKGGSSRVGETSDHCKRGLRRGSKEVPMSSPLPNTVKEEAEQHETKQRDQLENEEDKLIRLAIQISLEENKKQVLHEQQHPSKTGAPSQLLSSETHEGSGICPSASQEPLSQKPAALNQSYDEDDVLRIALEQSRLEPRPNPSPSSFDADEALKCALEISRVEALEEDKKRRAKLSMIDFRSLPSDAEKETAAPLAPMETKTCENETIEAPGTMEVALQLSQEEYNYELYMRSKETHPHRISQQNNGLTPGITRAVVEHGENHSRLQMPPEMLDDDDDDESFDMGVLRNAQGSDEEALALAMALSKLDARSVGGNGGARDGGTASSDTINNLTHEESLALALDFSRRAPGATHVRGPGIESADAPATTAAAAPAPTSLTRTLVPDRIPDTVLAQASQPTRSFDDDNQHQTPLVPVFPYPVYEAMPPYQLPPPYAYQPMPAVYPPHPYVHPGYPQMIPGYFPPAAYSYPNYYYHPTAVHGVPAAPIVGQGIPHPNGTTHPTTSSSIQGHPAFMPAAASNNDDDDEALKLALAMSHAAAYGTSSSGTNAPRRNTPTFSEEDESIQLALELSRRET